MVNNIRLWHPDPTSLGVAKRILGSLCVILTTCFICMPVCLATDFGEKITRGCSLRKLVTGLSII